MSPAGNVSARRRSGLHRKSRVHADLSGKEGCLGQHKRKTPSSGLSVQSRHVCLGVPVRRSCRRIFAAAALLLFCATPGNAATFFLSDGKTIEGEVVHATRNTLTVRQDIGGIRQLPRSKVKRVQIMTSLGDQISGPLKSWHNGVYEIEADGQLIQVRNREIIREATTTKQERTAPAAEAVEDTPAQVNPPVAAVEAVEVETSKQTPTASEPAADPASSPTLTVSAAEAREDATEIVFKLTLSRPMHEPIVIVYGTYDQTAIAGKDYHGERGTLRLAPGNSSATVHVPLINDDVPEGNETFELFVITDEDRATVEFDRTIGTILNDDE